jgi:NADH dehydrogenase FAD-containing subunit
LNSGKEISCDLYVPCHAFGGNCSFLSENSKDAKSYAKVNSSFLVEGFTNVFAVGDW